MVILITIDMTTLHIIGDSFTVPAEIVTGNSQRGLWASPGDSWNSGQPKPRINTWINQVAATLSKQHQDLDLVNYSQYGVAQDFCWHHLNSMIDKVQPDDYIIVAVTHPNRYWFFQEHPNLSNHHILELEKYIDREQRWAIQLFMQYIQRPELDTLQQTNRMKSLAYEILKKGLRRPLMMNCFPSDISQVEGIEELMWAHGNLYSIQSLEFESGEEDSTSYFDGVDCRYNHLCLSNHYIMAEKVLKAFADDQGPDLDQGFLTNLLKKDSLDDEEFCKKELDTNKLAIIREEQKTKSGWKVLR